MKTNKLVLSALALPLTIGFLSCKQSAVVDVEKPKITIIAPKEHAKLTIGDNHGVHLDMLLSDNESLASYKIDIHPHFDGHQHAPAQKVLTAVASADSIPYEFTKNWANIAGQKSASIHHHEIRIPKEVNGRPVKTGDYHLVVYCLDKAGNENHAAVEVQLTYEETENEHHAH